MKSMMRAIKTGYKPALKKHVKFTFPLKERKRAVLLFPHSPCFRSSNEIVQKIESWLDFSPRLQCKYSAGPCCCCFFFLPFVTKKMLFVLKTVRASFLLILISRSRHFSALWNKTDRFKCYFFIVFSLGCYLYAINRLATSRPHEDFFESLCKYLQQKFYVIYSWDNLIFFIKIFN